MASTHDDRRPEIQADVENLHRELEQLAAPLKSMPLQDPDDCMAAATILIRGK